MTTSVTPDAFLRALTKWGVKWRFYKDRADWLTHNRNGARNNQVTAGGFGPLRGVAAHNTASTSQTGMIAYLYNGDSARSLPGPLANWAILKTGEVVLLGWGTSNATGPGDPRPDALVRQNAMPLDREIVPTTAGPSDPNAILYAPYYLGFESCYASEGPTAAQYDAMVRTTVAALDAMGGPADKYSGGSVVMHRELTTTRSDPQCVGKAQLRRDVNAMFKAGPPKPTTTPEVPVSLKPTTTKLTSDRPGLTEGESLTLTASVSPAVEGSFYFDYIDSGMTEWVRFHTGPAVGGKITVTNRPARNVNYRVGFAPKAATTYSKAPWTGLTVAVVDLLRLMTEHRDLLARVEALEAAAPAAPVTTPGDTPS